MNKKSSYLVDKAKLITVAGFLIEEVGQVKPFQLISLAQCIPFRKTSIPLTIFIHFFSKIVLDFCKLVIMKMSNIPSSM